MSSGGMQGGYDQGTPPTANLMAPYPQFKELSPTQALAVGAKSAAVQSQIIQGHDCRNFRRGSVLDRGRGIIR